MILSKVCTKCNIKKPVSEFNKRAKAKDGLRFSCKTCDDTTRKEWFKNQEEFKAEVRDIVNRPGPGPTSLPPVPALAEADVEVSGGTAPPTVSAEMGAGGRVIGHINPQGPRIREVAVDMLEEADQKAAQEYAALLNKKLTIRQRANILVRIARSAKGPNAALALQALRDINTATGVISNKGAQIDLGPLIVMPTGTAMKMSGS